jgi:hypothetical protein
MTNLDGLWIMLSNLYQLLWGLPTVAVFIFALRALAPRLSPLEPLDRQRTARLRAFRLTLRAIRRGFIPAPRVY